MTILDEMVARLQAERVENETKLNHLLATIKRLVEYKQTVYNTPVMATATAMDKLKCRTICPAVPPDFDGDCSKGMAFLNSCQIYTHLCPKEFDDEQTKILWAMSCMNLKYGHVQRWTAWIFHWEHLPENSGYPRFLDWDDFHAEFCKEFTPAHANSLAVNRLESMAYFQKSSPWMTT